MPIHDDTNETSSSPELRGLSPTPADGLSEQGTTAIEMGISGNDPNANAMNANAEEVAHRQASGELAGSESSEIIENPESPAFQDGT